MMVLTRTLSFQILLVACLIGSLSALRFPSTYRTRKSSLSMISNKDLGAATITFSLFLSPAFATTTMNAASTTFGSNTYYSPPAVVKSTENGDKAQRAEKPTVPKFRTSQELALYNFQQKLITLREKEKELSKLLSTSKKNADTLKSTLSKAESQLNAAEARVKDNKAKVNNEYKAQKQKELNELQFYTKNIRGELRNAVSEKNRIDDNLKKVRVDIEDMKRSVTSKERETKEKLQQLAREDKAKLENEKKKQKENVTKEIKKQEDKAKVAAKKAVDESIKASEAVKVAAIEVTKMETELQKGLAAEKAAEERVESLRKEIQAAKDSTVNIGKSIAASREKLNAAQTNYKRLLNIEQKEKALEKTAKDSLSAISSKLK